jgi:hypothetical protein
MFGRISRGIVSDPKIFLRGGLWSSYEWLISWDIGGVIVWMDSIDSIACCQKTKFLCDFCDDHKTKYMGLKIQIIDWDHTNLFVL